MAQCTFAFGPFRLLLPQRLLLEGGQPVHLGSRALDILIALVERPGELVSKRELMNRVWPNMVVVEGNLTVHVATLRRALRDGEGGSRYLINIPGQGYRFVAPVALTEGRDALSLPPKSSTGEIGVPAQKTRSPVPADVTHINSSLRVLSAVASELGLEIWSGNAIAGLSDEQIRRLLDNGGQIFAAATGSAALAAPSSSDTHPEIQRRLGEADTRTVRTKAA
jgi:DNA-binding winged helix-turn-helix (wHTH) protein